MKGFVRNNPYLSLCGLNCKLCPMQLSGNCGGCGFGNQGCPIASPRLYGERIKASFCAQPVSALYFQGRFGWSCWEDSGLAREGLTARGMAEECFLDPLYDRWRRKSNPATDMLRMLKEGHDIEEVIYLYR